MDDKLQGQIHFLGTKRYNVKGPHYEKEFKMSRYMILKDAQVRVHES